MSQKKSLKLSNNYLAAYQEEGNGQPLLLLHGFMGEANSFLPLMSFLSQDFHCISVDLLGFGESSKPAINYDLTVQVEFLRTFIEKLQLNPCYILGYSFGGWVASAYALEFINHVKGLFLVAPAGIRDDSFSHRYTHLQPLLWQTPLVDWGLSLAAIMTKIMGKSDAVAKIQYFRQELLRQPVARSFLRSRLRPEDAIDTVEKYIHRLNLPTLVIAAEKDETIPLWHCQTYAHNIPNAQLFIISDADHNLVQTYPEVIAREIQKFLLKTIDN